MGKECREEAVILAEGESSESFERAVQTLREMTGLPLAEDALEGAADAAIAQEPEGDHDLRLPLEE